MMSTNDHDVTRKTMMSNTIKSTTSFSCHNLSSKAITFRLQQQQQQQRRFPQPSLQLGSKCLHFSVNGTPRSQWESTVLTMVRTPQAGRRNEVTVNATAAVRNAMMHARTQVHDERQRRHQSLDTHPILLSNITQTTAVAKRRLLSSFIYVICSMSVLICSRAMSHSLRHFQVSHTSPSEHSQRPLGATCQTPTGANIELAVLMANAKNRSIPSTIRNHGSHCHSSPRQQQCSPLFRFVGVESHLRATTTFRLLPTIPSNSIYDFPTCTYDSFQLHLRLLTFIYDSFH